MSKRSADKRQRALELARSNWQAYYRAHNAGHETYVTDSQKFNDFYMGDQWKDSDIQKLEAEGRPHLTINLIMKTVNAFLGEQKKQRADISYRPRRDATSEMAVVMSKLIEQILETNSFSYVEREVFSDGIIQDRGYYDIRLNFDDNVFGEINITAQDPYEILPDPDAKSYDPADWNEVIQTRWMTLEEIEAHYGEAKRKEVESTVRSGEAELLSENIRFDETRTFGQEENYSPTIEDVDLGDATIRCVRIIERQWRKLNRRKFFVDPEQGDMSVIPDTLSDEQIKQIQDQTGTRVISKKVKRVRWTVSTVDVVLHDEWSPYSSFTVVPYFPYFRKGIASGLVRQLISPQEQHNKYESQMLHVVNTSANSGWVLEAGSLANMTKGELEERGSETGLVIEYNTGRQPPEKIQPNNVPAGLDRIAERTKQSLSDIVGIDPMLGDTGENTVNDNAINQPLTRNMIQLQVPFDTLNFTRQLVGRKVLELVQEFYTENRIIRVTNWEDTQKPQEEIEVNYFDDAETLVNNLSIGTYDIMVSSKPARDTYQASQFAESLEMRTAGVMVPDDVVIRQSNLEGKHEIADRVADLQGIGEPTPEEQQLAEMQMQLQIQTQQLEVQKIEAEVMELNARAQEQFAKAQLLQGQEQRDAFELGQKARKEVADLQIKYQMQINDLQNKIELANIHTSNKRQVAMLDNAGKGFNEEIKNRTSLDVARIGASSRAAGSTGSK
jgi:hypothetical protein